MPPVDPAATVLARFGGAGPLAQLLRLDRSAVHRWALPKHRIDFAERVERFLAQHLK